MRAKHPRTAAGWESELRAQFADGRLGPRVARAIAAVEEQAAAGAMMPRPRRERFVVDEPPAYAAVPFVGERLAAIDACIAAAGGTLSTTLQRLAAVVGDRRRRAAPGGA